MHTNNILVTKQYSFRKGISTEDAAFRLTCSVFKPVNQKMHVGGIFYDLAKAFVCVSHEIVSAKSNLYGIQGTSEDWFKSSVTSRRQKVEVNSPSSTQNVFSAWGALKHGIPQESIPGPLLFIIHINDPPQRINYVS